MSAQPFKFDFNNGVIFVTFDEGIELTLEVIMEVIDQKNNLYDVKEFNSLWDFRGARPSDNFGYDAMERIVNYMNRNPDVQWSPQMAILADTGVQYGLSRMFQALANQSPIEIRIFHDQSEAINWVNGVTAVIDAEDEAPGP